MRSARLGATIRYVVLFLLIATVVSGFGLVLVIAACASPARRVARIERRIRLEHAFVDWIEECATVREAYASWSRATAQEAALAFAAYQAALDREERASKSFEALAP
jgi:hypothetical protein